MPRRNKYQANIYEVIAISIIGQSINNFLTSQDLFNNPRGDLIAHTFLITLPMMRRSYNDSMRVPYLRSSEEMLRLAMLPFLYDLCCYGFDSIGYNLLAIFTFSSAIYLVTSLALQISIWHSERIKPKVVTSEALAVDEHPESIAVTATPAPPLVALPEALPPQATTPVAPIIAAPTLVASSPTSPLELTSTSLASQEFNSDDEWEVVPERSKVTVAELQRYQLMSLIKESGGKLPDGVKFYVKGRSIEVEV